MFQIIPPEEFVTARWKNGGGVTHEIAKDAPDWGWRFSIAEVASDGPFSRFDGMARILTVIEGAGVDLHHAGGVVAARPLDPVRFSGDLAVDCRRVAGAIRDFNVIYDPKRFDAEVRVLVAGDHRLGPIAGVLDLGDNPMGFALGQGDIHLRAKALVVIITPRSG